MTLGRLMQLYQAEQAGKTIMRSIHRHGYYACYTRHEKVSIADQELSDLVNNEITGDYEGESSTTWYYYIKDEEDEYGYPIEE